MRPIFQHNTTRLMREYPRLGGILNMAECMDQHENIRMLGLAALPHIIPIGRQAPGYTIKNDVRARLPQRFQRALAKIGRKKTDWPFRVFRHASRRLDKAPRTPGIKRQAVIAANLPRGAKSLILRLGKTK
jgi:hypothetical protein